jgi:hypothetical protein
VGSIDHSTCDGCKESKRTDSAPEWTEESADEIIGILLLQIFGRGRPEGDMRRCASQELKACLKNPRNSSVIIAING